MGTRHAVMSAFFLASLACIGATAAERELKNDGFVDGQAVGFQSGFSVGEIGASRFIAPGGPTQLLKVRLLVGPAAVERTITLRVYDDTAGTPNPGAVIFDGDFELTGSANVMHQLDISGMSVFVPAQFRVGIESDQPGDPHIARDDDGTIAPNLNYIKETSLGWLTSQTLGLTGDWIIRAVVADASGSPDAGVTPDASVGPDAGGGEACDGNGDCAVGEYCDLEVHACTFDCRMDDDCGGAMACNSLGQCIAADGDGAAGCCSTGGGDGAVGALVLAGLVGAAVARRRRRRGTRAGGPVDARTDV